MIWQDILMGIIGFGYSLALIPAMRSKTKVSKITCLANVVLLALNGLALATLGLWLAALSMGLTLVAWAVLLVRSQK